MQTVEHLVVGGGAMGLATAWQLAKNDREVTVLEQFELDHKSGSSHGGTRIFRVSYRDPLYTNLALSSIDLWRELESETSSVLLEQIGQIDHGKEDALSDVKNSLDRHGLSYSVLTPSQALERWPGMNFDREVVFSPDGGRANAAQTIQSLALAVSELGGKISVNSRVTNVRLENDFAVVETENETYRSKSLTIAAGSWVHKLIGHLVKLPTLTIDIGQPAHYQPISSLAAADNWPSFIHHGDGRRVETNLAFSAYGLYSPGEGMKIGTWANTPPIDPDDRDFTVNFDLLDQQNKYVEKWFPGLQVDTADPISCLFTNTVDEHFILDRKGPITVCSPCSGHGFKFVPIIGKLTAQLAMGASQTVRQWQLPA